MTYENVYAAFPAYLDGVGNGIEYVTKNQCEWSDQCFVTFKKHWAESYGRSWQLAIRESEEILEQYHLHVVLLSEECCVIPARIRKPLFKDDGAYGYLWEEKIVSVKAVKNGTQIIMANETEIFSSTHLNTIKKYRRQARHLRNEFRLQKREGKIKEIIVYE